MASSMEDVLYMSSRSDIEDIAIGYELVTEEEVGDYDTESLIEMILEADNNDDT